MTVAELIEELRRLPGDPDLRLIEVQMTLRLPYAAETRVDGSTVVDVGVDHDVAYLRCYGYVE